MNEEDTSSTPTAPSTPWGCGWDIFLICIGLSILSWALHSFPSACYQ